MSNSEQTTSRAPSHSVPRKKVHKALRIAGLATLAIVLTLGSAFATLYSKLQGSIEQHEVTALLDPDARPDKPTAPPEEQKPGEPLNILVLGSDYRAKVNAQGVEYKGSVTGMRSDTTMILHISADRKRVDIVSIPRDTLVHIPVCKLPDGRETQEIASTLVNAAFALGGQTGDVNAAAACTIATVEELTNIFIDGYAVVDFTSFQDIVNTIGGIEMCFKEDIDDRASGLSVKAGCQTLMGEQALALARARKSLGDGSDIGRISRQQDVVNAIITKIVKLNPAANLTTFYRMLQDVTRNITVSEGMGDLDWLAGLAFSLKSIKPSDINFITMPFDYAGPRVVTNDRTALVWEALIADRPDDKAIHHVDTSPDHLQDTTPTTDPSATPTTSDSAN